MYPIFPFLTCEFSRGWHVSEREAEVAQVLVAAIVDRSQVLPLLDRRGKVHRVQRDLQLACKRRETLDNTLGNDATTRNAKSLFWVYLCCSLFISSKPGSAPPIERGGSAVGWWANITRLLALSFDDGGGKIGMDWGRKEGETHIFQGLSFLPSLPAFPSMFA